MSAKIRMVGMLIEYTKGVKELVVPDGKAVRQILKDLNIPSELVALVSVNGKAEDKDYIVHQGDEIQVMAVIGGG